MSQAEKNVWGCLECGLFVEALTPDGHCPDCGHGLVVELGGEPNAEKAQALIAWARRDATEVIQNRGTIVGGGCGLLLGFAVAFFGPSLGVGALVAVLYAGTLGALLGRLSALRVHRRLRPGHRLQPVVDAAMHRWLVVALGVWLVLPILVVAGLAAFGGPGGFAADGRRALASLWSLLSGE